LETILLAQAPEQDTAMLQKSRWRDILCAAIAIAVLLGMGAAFLFATHVSQGVDFAMKLMPGWNLANTLDAWGLGNGAGAPDVYETYWGSMAVTKAEINAIAAAGFHTLRVPITWFEHMEADDRIDPVWLDRVQTIVDWALDAGMHVIVNAHHDRWYTPDPAKLDTALATMRAVWGQIAQRFQAYGDHLLFEGMNEPRLIGQPEEWTAGTPAARDCVNQLNATFVQTVRATGGENITRYLLVPAYCASVRAEALSALVLPADSHVMVSAHLYAPYDFTLNEHGTADFSTVNDRDTASIREAFRQLTSRFTSRGVPVVLTEFGAMDKGNAQARTAWAAYVTSLAKAAGIPTVWWDTSLMEQPSLQWRYPTLLNALLR